MTARIPGAAPGAFTFFRPPDHPHEDDLMHAATTSTESLLRLSLNDHLFLEALVRLESLKDAADEFGLTRASASRTLARLRAAAGEPLFVRSNPNLVPTPEARRLATAIRRLRLVTRELAPPGAPEPLTLARHFTIGAGENATYAFCLPVIERLNTIAPRVSVSIEHFEPERLFELLQSGKLDIAFYPQEVLPPHFESAVLSTNNIVAMVRREHPLLDLARERELTLGDLEAYPKIRVSSAVARPFDEDDESDFAPFYHACCTPDVPSVPYFLSALELLSRSDALLSVAQRTAEAALRRFSDCAILPIPPLGRRDYKVRAIWHRRLSRDPEFLWFKGVMAGVLKRD